MIKHIIIALNILLLSGCSYLGNLKHFNSSNSMTFSATEEQVLSNLKCDSIFKTDKLNSVDEEVFRCSGYRGDIFLEVKSNGNNSEKIKQSKLVWKDWDIELSPEDSKVIASQFSAVFAKIYSNRQRVDFVQSFFNSKSDIFKYNNYSIKIESNEKDFYTVRTATVSFK